MSALAISTQYCAEDSEQCSQQKEEKGESVFTDVMNLYIAKFQGIHTEISRTDKCSKGTRHIKINWIPIAGTYEINYIHNSIKMNAILWNKFNKSSARYLQCTTKSIAERKMI